MPLWIRFTLIGTTVTLWLVHRVALVIDNFYWLIIGKAFVVAFKLFSGSRVSDLMPQGALGGRPSFRNVAALAG